MSLHGARKTAVLFGHSFVSRLRQHLVNTSAIPASMSEILKVNQALTSFTLVGQGGAVVSHFEDFCGSWYGDATLDILIVDIGSNDLCDMDVDGRLLARRLVDSARSLVERSLVVSVSFALVLDRTRTRSRSLSSFSSEVEAFNSELKVLCSSFPWCFFFRHQGLVSTDIRLWSSDGIHPNTDYGMEKYRRSIRSQILRVVSEMNKAQ